MTSSLFIAVALLSVLGIVSCEENQSLEIPEFLACVFVVDATSQLGRQTPISGKDVCSKLEKVAEKCLSYDRRQAAALRWTAGDVQRVQASLQDRLNQHDGCTINLRSMLSRATTETTLNVLQALLIHDLARTTSKNVETHVFHRVARAASDDPQTRGCRNAYIQAIADMTSFTQFCSLSETFITCMFQGRVETLSAEQINTLIENLETQINAHPNITLFDCDIDVARAVEKAKGSDGDTTAFTKCEGSFQEDLRSTTSLNQYCGIFKKLINCIISHTDNITEIPESEIRLVQWQLNDMIAKLGIQCDIDVKALVETAQRNSAAKSSPRFGMYVLSAVAFILFVMEFGF